MLVPQVGLTFLENGTLRCVSLQEDLEGRTLANGPSLTGKQTAPRPVQTQIVPEKPEC